MRNFILSLLFLLPLLGWAQIPTISVSGTVTNSSTGQPIANQIVYVMLDSTVAGGWAGSANTNLNGAYSVAASLNFMPPAGTAITVYTFDCNGAFVALNYTTTGTATAITNANFQICAGGGTGTNCQASFTQGIQNGILYANSTSSASGPSASITSYAWTFSGMTSSVANPAFNLANVANGVYTLCLTITDNTGCSSTYCDSVLVSTGGGGTSCSNTYTYNVGTGGVVTLVGSAWSSSGAGCSATYNWTMSNGTSFSTATSATLTLQPGVYGICLTTTDCNGCVANYCDSISVTNTNPTNYSLSGYVFVDSMSSPALGFDSVEVYLIQHDVAAGTLNLVQSQLTATWVNPNSPYAYFNFTNLAAGDYLVKAAMHNSNSVNYANFMPTYYASNVQSLFWSGASNLAVPNNGSSIYLHLLAGNNPGGPGFVGGLISQGANKGAASGMADIEVLLLDLNDNPVAYTYSDLNGNYSFSNLAYGTYKIWAEVLGKTTTPTLVTISANNPNVTADEIYVNSTTVTSGIFDNAYFSGVSLFPNPSKGVSNLKIEMKQSGKVSVEVMSLVGQKVFATQEMFSQGTNEVALNTANYPKGVYFVKVNAGAKAATTLKLVVE